MESDFVFSTMDHILWTSCYGLFDALTVNCYKHNRFCCVLFFLLWDSFFIRFFHTEKSQINWAYRVQWFTRYLIDCPFQAWFCYLRCNSEHSLNKFAISSKLINSMNFFDGFGIIWWIDCSLFCARAHTHTCNSNEITLSYGYWLIKTSVDGTKFCIPMFCCGANAQIIQSNTCSRQ